jgi:hypothetical protein
VKAFSVQKKPLEPIPGIGRFWLQRRVTLALWVLLCACVFASGSLAEGPLPAFPGAEGFGAMAQGGRGGRVIKVTHLGDSGKGSLRKAVEAEGPRTIVFDVSGTIELKKPIVIRNSHLTLAGQTARAGGITLKNYGVAITTDHVIVRYLRVRPGDSSGEADDALWIRSGQNIIIDHCSASWASDETLSVSPREKLAMRPIDRVTVQWCIISESLNRSVHAKGEHGYGSLVRGSAGARYSFHNNLWAHHNARMPRPGNYVDAKTDPAGPLLDFRNNVFYNWGGKTSGYNADRESVSRYNFINNAYLAGPDSRGALAFREQNPLAGLHFSGNTMNGALPDDPWSLVRFDDERTHGNKTRFETAPVTTVPADTAYERVLQQAGASHARDAVDQRVVMSVRQATGRIIDHPNEVAGWPDIPAGEPVPDRDGDGMPDEWESARGLNPDNPDDGAADSDGNGYTELEDYLNSLVAVRRIP